jgi:hypothetical protein
MNKSDSLRRKWEETTTVAQLVQCLASHRMGNGAFPGGNERRGSEDDYSPHLV